VLQSVTGNQIQRSVYTPYGGSAVEGGLQSLLGFNGEQALQPAFDGTAAIRGVDTALYLIARDRLQNAALLIA
ncbi:hypothetical protein QCD79_33880, partial [Pseudomonas quasicaspiana]|nr:hypothetical protein [Pseudomonas quasicaspiana]